MGCIYLARNKVNGKKYVGQTIRLLHKRKLGHEHFAAAGYEFPLSRAIRKYGKDAFDWKVIHNNVPEEKLNELEIKAIRKHRCKSPNGYNLTDGGGGCRGWKHPEETRKKMKAAASKRPPHPPHSEETKLKISLANKGKNKGKKASEETKAKLRKKLRERPSEFWEWIRRIARINGRKRRGMKHSEESRRRMSEAQKARILPPETVREMGKKISEANMGHSVSPEHREKVRQKSLAWWAEHKGESRWTRESKIKQKESLRKFWESPESDAVRKKLSDLQKKIKKEYWRRKKQCQKS